MVRAVLGLLLPLRTPTVADSPRAVEDWTRRRRPQSEQMRLSAQATAWCGQLPEFARPKVLCARHPHVANRLATLWSEPEACVSLLESLLIDARGGRSGFAPSVRAEIVRLERYHVTVTATRPARG